MHMILIHRHLGTVLMGQLIFTILSLKGLHLSC